MSESAEPVQFPGIPGYNPDNIQPWLVEVVVSITILALVAVGLRLFSRHIKAQRLWWDDYMIVFSMFWNLLTMGFIFAMYSQGMGLHADKLSMDEIVMMAKYLLVAEILYVFNLAWTKISLLLMYYRIFNTPIFKKMAWIIGVFVLVWVVCITFLFIFICVPVEKLWYPELPGHCIDQVATWIANAASTILTDLIILLLPLPQVWKLQLRIAEKLALTIAFGLGFFIVFVSAYRTSVLFTYTNTDPSYTLAPTVGWTAIEISAGITSACLPTLRPAMQVLARAVGIKGSFGGMFRGATHGGTSGNARGKGGSALATIGGTELKVPNSTISSTVPMGSEQDADDGGGVDRLAGKSTPKGAAARAGNFSSFFRLPDETSGHRAGKDASGGGGAGRGSESSSDGAVTGHSETPLESPFRPDVTGFVYSVESRPAKSDGDDESGDETPLQGIRVQRTYVSS